MSSTACFCNSGVNPKANPCPLPCSKQNFNCSDAISLSVQAILNLAQNSGSIASDIFQIAASLCPHQSLLQSDIDAALLQGAKQGVFIVIFASPTSTPTYMVNSNMVQVNVKNAKYFRPPCQLDSFFRK